MKQPYTLERRYMIPRYDHLTVEAESVEEACRLALENDYWDLSEMDYDCCGDVVITKCVHGEYNTPYAAPAEAECEIPEEFVDDGVQP